MTRTKVKHVDDVAILRTPGSLIGGKETDELVELIDQLNAKGNLKLVINLQDTGLVTTPGLSALLGAHLKYAKRGGRVALCHVDDRLNNLLVITRLCFVFDAYRTEPDAVVSFAVPTS